MINTGATYRNERSSDYAAGRPGASNSPARHRERDPH
jgi:hypothetical protein